MQNGSTATCRLQRDFWPAKEIKSVCFRYLGSKVGLSPRNGGLLMRPEPICKQTYFSRENEGLCLFSMRNRVDSLSFFFHCDIIMCVIIGLIEIWALTVFKGCWKRKRRHLSVSPASLKYNNISDYTSELRVSGCWF